MISLGPQEDNYRIVRDMESRISKWEQTIMRISKMKNKRENNMYLKDNKRNVMDNQQKINR